MSDYVYNFADQAIKGFNTHFETRVGDNTAHHSSCYFDLLTLLLRIYQQGSVLDIGAGVGRATRIARQISREVVALEPDHARWSLCHEENHVHPGCLVFNQTSREYHYANPARTFDLVIVGAVLQHLATDVCVELLDDVVSLLKPGGVVLIYTSHTLDSTKGFSFSGDSKRFYVSEEEFNEYAKSIPSSQNLGIPVRRFSRSELSELLPDQLDTIFWQQVAYYREDSLQMFADRYQIEPDKLKDTGHQQIFIAQKKQLPGS
jgi:SAM-dependent methyltransferase